MGVLSFLFVCFCFSPDGVAGVCHGIPLHEGPDQEPTQLLVPPSYQCTQPRAMAASGVCPLPCPARGRVRPGNVSVGAVSAGKCCSSGETSRVPA